MPFSTNNLSTLPDISTLVTWQNNVTRLNQSNLNNMTNGISSVITSLKGFGTDVTNYFNSIDTEISTLKDEDTALNQAVQLNTDFRVSHSEDFNGLTEVFRYEYNQNKTSPYAGIIYSNGDHPLVINSQPSPLVLEGGSVESGYYSVEIRGNSVEISGDLTINDSVNLQNQLSGTSATFSGNVRVSNNLTAQYVDGVFANFSEITVIDKIVSTNNIIIETPKAQFSQEVSAQTVSAQSITSNTAVHTQVTASSFIDSFGNVVTDFSELRPTTETYQGTYTLDDYSKYVDIDDESYVGDKAASVKFIQQAIDTTLSEVNTILTGLIDGTAYLD